MAWGLGAYRVDVALEAVGVPCVASYLVFAEPEAGSFVTDGFLPAEQPAARDVLIDCLVRDAEYPGGFFDVDQTVIGRRLNFCSNVRERSAKLPLFWGVGSLRSLALFAEVDDLVREVDVLEALGVGAGMWCPWRWAAFLAVELSLLNQSADLAAAELEGFHYFGDGQEAC